MALSPYKRIFIAGCPGSGKTTLAMKLAAMYELPVVHLDALALDAGGSEATETECATAAHDRMLADSWVMEGYGARWQEEALANCDLFVFLTPLPLVCILGVLQRSLVRLVKMQGRDRIPDLAGNYRPRSLRRLVAHLRYIAYVANKNRREELPFPEKGQKPCIIVLRDRRQVRSFCRKAAMEAYA